ncbi:MAG: hypothetical protein CVU62_01055 [Deltaproteobacteria bacterium HGW-Deltaproteobacteria-2]|jgi:hypothetical protein|nr:MAG: hypothetical protein CVU62_01055 [Deltaproteobacteria bacterium HGW-Deltaproteobacteria-2]
MEIVSRLNQRQRYQCDVEIHPYLRDHHLEGKVILPAVESLIVLTRAIETNYPQAEISCLQNAVFSRFLTITPDIEHQPVIIDMKNYGNGIIAASLLTSMKSKTGTISREVEHMRVEFCVIGPKEFYPPPFRVVNKLKGDCISVPSATIYRELVTFGAAYQNIMGDLSVSSEGALAYISGGDCEADEDLLGSPFPLDAIMHAACVWGQRFANIVSFPVGFGKRIIYQKAKKREGYLGRVVPVSITKESLLFDAWIYKDNVMCEYIKGVKMKDVTKGRMSPPDWIKEKG